MKYFAKIKYLGTGFHGFQVQPGQRTIQGELSSACLAAFGYEAKVTGCSRTDSGVHANEFCLTIECDKATVPPEKLPMALARFLPNDISLFSAEQCASDFHPRYNVKSKEYLYRIRSSRISDPFDCGRVWFLSYDFDEKMLSLMNEAAKYFIGTQDFAAFMSEGSGVQDTVRTIYYLNIEKNGDCIDIKISADGFLYNMVRIVVGTLVDVALSRIKPSEIASIIKSKDRSKAGITAPADGLYLNKVIY
ncbi:MAG: tRNA pseudouridine(38-40) synthase TruA [Clostridia bacterium]|nr:tRNA pseudouridine(38-40) synthase TruA [Clostridia bacterium]